MNVTNTSDDPSLHINGVVMMITCIVTSVFYVPCAYVMATDLELNVHASYRLMLQQALCDACNLAMHFCIGFLYTFNITIPHWLNKVYFGITICMGHFVYLPLILVIAFNRCLVIVFYNKPWSDVLFSKSATKFWMSLCFIDGIIWCLIMMSPNLDIVYERSAEGLTYVGLWFEQVLIANFIQTTVCIYGSIGCYLITIGYLVATRNSMENQTNQQGEMQKQERKITKQAAIICLYPWIHDSYYYIVMLFGAPFNNAVYHQLWVFNSAINPVVYLAMNDSIQKKVKRMIFKDENTVQPISIPMNPTQQRAQE